MPYRRSNTSITRLYAISVFLNVRTNIADTAAECEMKNIARPNAFALNETLKVSNRNERIMKIRISLKISYSTLGSRDCTRRTTRRNQRQSSNSFEEGFFFPLFLAASPAGPAAACKRVAHVCKSICTRVCMRPGKGNRPAAVGSLLDNDTARASGTCLTRSSLSPFPSSSSLSRSLLFFFPFLGEVCTPSFLCILSIHRIGYGCSRISNRSLAANDCCIVDTRSSPPVINYSDEYVCLRVIKTSTLWIFWRSTLQEIKRWSIILFNGAFARSYLL